MKTTVRIILFYAVVVIGIPALTVLFSEAVPDGGTEEKHSGSREISAYITESGEVIKMDMETYLKGVVAAEMPASFEKEALKAQAIAARSYMLSRMENYKKSGAPSEHKGADTCDNPSHCEAWLSDEKLKEKWGDSYDEYNKKITGCVNETAGLVMTYNGKIANAVFHSTSSGETESAADVWGSDVPYLESVASLGDELSPKFSSSVTMSVDDFKKTVTDFNPSASWGEADEVVGEIDRSAAGGIKTITIGGISMSGAQFRSLFELNGTNAYVSSDGEKVSINVTGNGHGVGMSQYGANYLAAQGKDFKQILTSYYTGIKIENAS